MSKNGVNRLLHRDLVVSRVGIKETEGFAPRRRVNYLIYVWQRKRILWARLVKTRVVNAHSPLPTLLSHKKVPQPLGVVDFLDEACREEFLYLLAYGPTPLLVEPA